MDVKETEEWFRIDRHKYEEVFGLLVRKVDPDDPERCLFNNDTFSLHPFVWVCKCPDAKKYPEGDHGDNCIHKKPNFIYKLDNYKLNWYKYPLRGAEENRKTDISEFMDIINHCLASLE
jgi:hypothetical protein